MIAWVRIIRLFCVKLKRSLGDSCLLSFGAKWSSERIQWEIGTSFVVCGAVIERHMVLDSAIYDAAGVHKFEPFFAWWLCLIVVNVARQVFLMLADGSVCLRIERLEDLRVRKRKSPNVSQPGYTKKTEPSLLRGACYLVQLNQQLLEYFGSQVTCKEDNCYDRHYKFA